MTETTERRRGRVLVIDDDQRSCEMTEEGLVHRGFSVVWRTSGEAGLALVESGQPFDVVITDLRMRGMDGLELCERLVARAEGLPVVVITAFGSIQTAVEAMRKGAYDFLTKPFDLDVVAFALDRAIGHRALRTELDELKSKLAQGAEFETLLGDSPAMHRVYDLIARVAPSDSTVLLSGESGTGKEVAARALHQRSNRARGPFVAVNCAAIPEHLLESELFGHVRGAFTDARGARAGLLVRAAGGTLFLDEIGDMPLGMQAKLLRVLQERTVRPVGSDEEVPFSARVVAATHRDLDAEITAGRFRRDLYFRINVIEVVLPPLRARGSDVLLLAQAFISQLAQRTGHASGRELRLSHEAAEKLLVYEWPGNVRELENCIERAVAVAREQEIGVADLPDRVRNAASRSVIIEVDEPGDLVPLEEVERRYILRAMQAVRGNKKLAAQLLGLDRSTLYRKLERYGADTDKDKDKDTPQ